MTIELPQDTRARAIASIERWFEIERDERIGNISAGALLGFFLDEIGPSVYNLGVAHAQERMQERQGRLGNEASSASRRLAARMSFTSSWQTAT